MLSGQTALARDISQNTFQAFTQIIVEKTKEFSEQQKAKQAQGSVDISSPMFGGMNRRNQNQSKPGVAGSNNCSQNNPYGEPLILSIYKDKIQKRSFNLCYTGYSAKFDPATKTPIWVAERLTRDEMLTTPDERTNDFRPSPDVPAKAQASLADYKGSGFDRGHMAPAADQTGRAPNAMSESFYLVNMVPQVGPNQNRGIWADIESQVRRWAKERGELIVVTGPVYKAQNYEENIKIGRSGVSVPEGLYKVVLDPNTMESAAFLVPNRQVVTSKTRSLDAGNPAFPQTTGALAVNCASYCDMSDFMVPVSKVEKATHLKFFSSLDANKRLDVVSSVAFRRTAPRIKR